MKITSIQELFLHKLGDLYSAESQILKALPTMITEASDENLRKALKDHLEVTKAQEDRLDAIYERHAFDKSQECKGMEGIIEEGSKVVSGTQDSSIRDVAIIAAARTVEHYEMIGYESAMLLAKILEQSEDERLLSENHKEEMEADKSLGALARGNMFKEGLGTKAAE